MLRKQNQLTHNVRAILAHLKKSRGWTAKQLSDQIPGVKNRDGFYRWIRRASATGTKRRRDDDPKQGVPLITRPHKKTASYEIALRKFVGCSESLFEATDLEEQLKTQEVKWRDEELLEKYRDLAVTFVRLTDQGYKYKAEFSLRFFAVLNQLGSSVSDRIENLIARLEKEPQTLITREDERWRQAHRKAANRTLDNLKAQLLPGIELPRYVANTVESDLETAMKVSGGLSPEKYEELIEKWMSLLKEKCPEHLKRLKDRDTDGSGEKDVEDNGGGVADHPNQIQDEGVTSDADASPAERTPRLFITQSFREKFETRFETEFTPFIRRRIEEELANGTPPEEIKKMLKQFIDEEQAQKK